MTLVAGAVAVAGCLLVWRLVLPARGHALAAAPTLRAAAGSVLYLVLVAWLGFGAATGVRNSAAAIGTVLGLLYVFPMLAQMVSDPDWQMRLQQVGRMTAGLAIQSTTGLDGLPIGPWAGLGVLAAWAAAALLAGGLVLCLQADPARERLRVLADVRQRLDHHLQDLRRPLGDGRNRPLVYVQSGADPALPLETVGPAGTSAWFNPSSRRTPGRKPKM